MNHYTSLEQSKKLLELGLSPESADMIYTHKTVFYNMMENRLYVDEDNDWHLHQRSEIAFMDTGNEIPCWSLGALLDVMPMIECERGPYRPMFGKFIMNRNYYCDYSNDCQEGMKIILSDTPMEAAYSMVIWLLENGYIKK